MQTYQRKSDVKKKCDPDKADATPEEEKLDWDGPEEPDGQKDDDVMQGIEADEVPDDDQIRNLLRARALSFVLLAAHRMIGICRKVGDCTSVDPDEAPDWSTDRA